MRRITTKKEMRRDVYSLGGLPVINLGYVKQLCDNYNVQINFIFNPDHVQMRIYKIDPHTGTLSKSEKHVFSNEELGYKFNPSILEMVIRNVISDLYPSTMIST